MGVLDKGHPKKKCEWIPPSLAEEEEKPAVLDVKAEKAATAAEAKAEKAAPAKAEAKEDKAAPAKAEKAAPAGLFRRREDPPAKEEKKGDAKEDAKEDAEEDAK